jgi:ribose 5-phosphate isomerase RpiB
MDVNGRLGGSAGRALHWQGRIVSAEDLRQRLDGHAELVVAKQAVITPLAADELRARGVRIIRQSGEDKLPSNESGGQWLMAQERRFALVAAAIPSLQRDGRAFQQVAVETGDRPTAWAVNLARRVGNNECRGAIVFCADPALVSCVANKCQGVRGVAVYSVGQATRAASALGANFIAVEMPGRTLFEVRRILATFCGEQRSGCPEPIAAALKELDGHAHR